MLRQSLIYLLLSLFVVFFSRFAAMLVVYVDIFYAFVNVQLIPVFNAIGLGFIARKIFLLVFLPVAVAAIPALLYRLIKGKTMPYLFQLTWCLWFILVLGIVLIRY
ncbi:MAG: hypothetical protein WC785_02755 [Tatlockia sp.]|jgi:hypothetical protein